MLTRLRIKNFKRFPDADIELGQAVVFNPPPGGKTSYNRRLQIQKTNW
jgi:predicted ATPase